MAKTFVSFICRDLQNRDFWRVETGATRVGSLRSNPGSLALEWVPTNYAPMPSDAIEIVNDMLRKEHAEACVLAARLGVDAPEIPPTYSAA